MGIEEQESRRNCVDCVTQPGFGHLGAFAALDLLGDIDADTDAPAIRRCHLAHTEPSATAQLLFNCEIEIFMRL